MLETSEITEPLPELAFRVDFGLSLYWHTLAKYGSSIPLPPFSMEILNQRYALTQQKDRRNVVRQLLKSLADASEGLVVFERAIGSSGDLVDPSQWRESFSEKSLENWDAFSQALSLEEVSFRPIFEKDREKLSSFCSWLQQRWVENGRVVLHELSRLSGMRWNVPKIEVRIVHESLFSGIRRQNYLVLPYSQAHEVTFCVLVHLLSRYVASDLAVELLADFVGPSLDLYLDAIYGLLTYRVLSLVKERWPEMRAPVEPVGGREYPIFKSLQDRWQKYVRGQSDDTFSGFLKRIMAEDLLPIETVRAALT